MFKSLTRVLVLIGLVALTGAAGSLDGLQPELLAAEVSKTPTTPIVEANSRFAFDLYQQLGKENEGKNLFFSPYSISSALAMSVEGARGETAKQMGTVLRFPDQARRAGNDAQLIPWQTSKVHTGMGALNHRFNREKKPYQLTVANGLWAERTYPFRKQFVDALREPYGAAINTADFINNPDGERQRINGWVEQKTNDRIKELFAPGTIDSLTRLVLTNAIYFKGNWAVMFKEKLTQDRPFTLADGTKQNVKMMYHPAAAQRDGAKKGEAPFRYAAFNTKGAPLKGLREKPAFEVLELPYRSDELSMILLLPQPGGLANLEKQLDADRLDEWIGQLRRQKVFVHLPRFKMENGYALKKTLKALGMPAAFEPGGFTGLSDSPSADKLYITSVQHKAFVEVNEEGTEAAAATGVAFGLKSAPRHPRFNANRPFIFAIRDTATGSLLFLGRVMNPSE